LWKGYVLFAAKVQIMQLHQSLLNGEWRVHPHPRKRS
jgi:hypothetical protein